MILPGSTPMPYISLMRPKDWVKNAFVLIPVLFWFNSPTNDDQLALHVVLGTPC